MRFRLDSLPLLTVLLLSTVAGYRCVQAATLELLPTERLIDESTEIVRGTVNYCNYLYRPPMIYTVCEIDVTERFKGPNAAKVQVAIPGGVAAGYRQTFEGVPTLVGKSEYLFFLWQGKNGLKQIMGLSQGVLNLTKDSQGNLIVTRARIEERMLNAAGAPVQDAGLSLRLAEFSATIRSRVSGSAAKAVRQ